MSAGMVGIEARMRAAYATLPPESQATVERVVRKLGVLRLWTLARDAWCVVRETAASAVPGLLRTLVVREARRLGMELSTSEAELFVGLLLDVVRPTTPEVPR